MSFSNWDFVLNFKDPATLYAQSLIAVHHNVMWYLILIISIVYWMLYRLLRDFSWNSFNKLNGFLRIFFFSKFFAFVEGYVVYVWAKMFSLVSDWLYSFFLYIDRKTVEFDLQNNFPIFPLIGLEYVEGFSRASWANSSELTLSVAYDMVLEKYLDYYLYGTLAPGYYYYDEELPGVNSFLGVQKFRHSTLFEFVWATFPTVIILLLLVPAMLLLYSLDEDLDPRLTVKVIGHQWFWSYEFDNWLETSDGEFVYLSYDYDSSLVVDDYLAFGDKRLLEVDNPVIVPVNTTLRFLVTSADVIHSWAIPELGIKIDGVPGRLSQYLSFIKRPGFFYGQCSELCGVAHGFMPIVVLAV